MPNERRFAHDETYSEWHRVSSIGRWMSYSEADSLCYIDCDFIEACKRCYEPILLVEAVRDFGQDEKCAKIVTNLGRMADLPVAVVFYMLAETRQPAPRDDLLDIERFRVRWISPDGRVEEKFYWPEQWANVLLKLRRRHDSACRRVPAVA